MRYQVPVMVVFESEHQLDSAQIAEILHAVAVNYDQYGGEGEEFTLDSINGIPSDEDDPNSPPVPAERLMSLDEAEDPRR